AAQGTHAVFPPPARAHDLAESERVIHHAVTQVTLRLSGERAGQEHMVRRRALYRRRYPDEFSRRGGSRARRAGFKPPEAASLSGAHPRAPGLPARTGQRWPIRSTAVSVSIPCRRLSPATLTILHSDCRAVERLPSKDGGAGLTAHLT